MIQKTLAFTLIFAFSVAGGMWYGNVRELNAAPTILEGGISVITDHCGDGSIVVEVGPPKPVHRLKVWPAAAYIYQQFAGSWVVGNATPGGWCAVGKGGFHTTGTAVLIGTSLI